MAINRRIRQIGFVNVEHISSTNLRRAADIKDKIDGLQAELAKILGSSTAKGNLAAGRKLKSGRRRMSATAKAKIAAAQRARWAKWKAAKK